MHDTQHSLKRPAKAALSVFAVLLIGAVLLFKERVFFADSAYVVFNVINNRQVSIYHQHFGAFLVQVFPWLGQMAHWPLNVLLIGYGTIPYIFFLVVALLIICVFREYKIAILMALYYLLLVSDSYFMGVEDISQGAAWMFLFLATVLYAGRNKMKFATIIIPFVLLAALALSAHFTLIIPFTFLWVYLLIEKENWHFSRRHTIVMSSLLISVIAIKILVSAFDGYDSSHLHGIIHISPIDIVDAFVTPVVQMFGYRCVTNYWIGVIVFVLGLVSLFKAKQKLLLAWTITSFIGYVVLMGITYRDFDRYLLLFHIELEWKSMGMIFAAPFVFTFLPSIKPSRGVTLLVIIFAVRLGYIAASIPAFSNRLKFKRAVIAKMKEKNIRKLALYNDDAIRKEFILEWAIPYETIMETALQGDSPQYTFFIVNPDDTKTLEAIKDPHSLYLYNVTSTETLNKDYFIADSGEGYRALTYKELLK